MHLIHRGIVNKNYKENLLNSFKTSFKKGYGIETDIHATKDGEFVCFHDFTLKRIHKINKRWGNFKKRRMGPREGDGKGNQKIKIFGN